MTAFTLAHSLTLAAATLGWVHVAQAPVEAGQLLFIVSLLVLFRGVTIGRAYVIRETEVRSSDVASLVSKPAA